MIDPPKAPPSEKDLLLATIDMPTDQRSDYLNAACGSDIELKARVNDLLKNAESDGSFMASPALDLNATTAMSSISVGGQIGRYRLLEQIGEGGMGVVYVAEQLEPVRRKVALKVIKPGMDSKQVIARFDAERQALAMMEHSNIARVFDAGTTDQGLPYFVMELVRGMSITKYCDQAKLGTNERLALFIEVCGAVQHAHQKGIIHRDIKPGNVLVTLHDGKPVVKVIDFGVAKAIHQQLSNHSVYTAFNQVVGTPLYMSPEQLELSGLDIDTRSDIYSLGVLLYELLTGDTPFDRERLLQSGLDEMRRIIREEDPPRPSHRITTMPKAELSTFANKRGLDQRTFSNSVQSELDWITLKALEKDRNRRYESSSALGADIKRYLDNEPVLACPPSWRYRLGKLSHRYRAALISICLVLLGLLTAVAGTSWQAVRAIRAEGESDERLANLVVEQQKTKNALIAAELSEKEQRRMRAEAEEAALREQNAAQVQIELRQKAEQAKREAKWNVYVAKLSSLQNALEARDFGKLDSLLKETVPSDDEPDFRGWEWYYLRDRVDSVSTEIDHARTFGPIAWNPAGTEFAIRIDRAGSHSIDIWNTESLRRIRRVECPGKYREIAWSSNGKMIAVGIFGTCELIVFNSSDGAVLWRSHPVASFSEGSRDLGLVGLSWNSDNHRIAVGNRLGEIAIVDIGSKTTTTLRRPEKPDLLGDLQWHPDGNRLAAGLRFGERTIFDVSEGSAIQLDKLNLEVGAAIAWSRSGKLVATSEGHEIRIADENGKTVCSLIGHTGSVEQLSWLDDQLLVSASRDQTIRLWDTSKRVIVETLKIHDGPIRHMAISPNGSRLLSETNGITRISDLQPLQEEMVTRISKNAPSELEAKGLRSAGLKNSIVELKWKSDGSRLCGVREIFHLALVGGGLSTLSPISMRQIATYNTGFCKGLAWSPDGTQLFRSAIGNRLVAEDVRTGTLIQSNSCEQFGETIAFWSPSTKYVVTFGGEAGPNVRTSYDAVSLSDWSGTLGADGKSVAWSPHETNLIAGGYGQPKIMFLNGQQKAFPDNVSNSSFGTAWHPSGKLIATGNESGLIVFRDSETLEILLSLKGHSNDVMDLSFSPDGRRLASASFDGTVRIWDSASGTELLQLTVAGVTGFRQIEWTPDGLQLAAGTTHGEIVVFGSNELQPTPISATVTEAGALLKAFEQKTGQKFELTKNVPRLGWRDHLSKLKLAAGNLTSPLDVERFERLSAEMLTIDAVAQGEFENFVRGWLILIEAHNDPDSAKFLADRLLRYLSNYSGATPQEKILELRLEALMLAGQRSSNTVNENQAGEYYSEAVKLAEQLSTSHGWIR